MTGLLTVLDYDITLPARNIPAARSFLPPQTDCKGELQDKEYDENYLAGGREELRELSAD